MDLLDSDEDEEKVKTKLSINKNYAERYDRWRGKEVLQRLKDKHGDVKEDSGSGSSSESESSEDSEAEGLTEEVEKKFFQTLASLKTRDPRIYDEKTVFFTKEEEDAKKKKKQKAEKKMTLGDLERKIILEKEGKYEEMEDETIIRQSREDPTYAEEMRAIKDQLKEAVAANGHEESDEDEDLLKPRQKSAKEKEKEESEYKAWLAGQRSEISDPSLAASMAGLKTFWSDSTLDEGEKFLKDYILNKRYLTNDDDDDDDDGEEETKVSAYDQIVHDSDEGLSEDERNVAKQEEFEHKFNFRFEEPDEDFIKRYPRTIKDSMRRPEEKRKKKRAEILERKKQEKQTKKEELKLLKSIKKREILDKLEKLKKITGNEDMAIKDEDIDGDFDPVAYDRRMKELFENYDDSGPVDDEKPTFSDLDEEEEFGEEELIEDWDNWAGPSTSSGRGEGGGRDTVSLHCEDPDFNMDCEAEGGAMRAQQELIESTRGRKKSKRRSKFAEVLEQQKPLFNPQDKTFEQYVEEYYKLDCEDVIGDLPCRFKYRTVEPNDFGLSTEEILAAEDAELNAWVSLRKTCQYRPDAEERKDVHVYRNKGRNLQLKRKVLPSLFKETIDDEDNGEGGEDADESTGKPTETKSAKKRKKKLKAKQNAEERGDGGESASKKIKLMNAEHKTSPGKPADGSATAVENRTNGDNSETNGKKKKKKRKKKSAAAGGGEESTNKARPPPSASKETAAMNGNKKKRRKKKNKMAGGADGSSSTPANVAALAKFFPSAHKSTAAPAAAAKPRASQYTDERLKAYGINPNQYNRMLKKQKYKDLEKKKT